MGLTGDLLEKSCEGHWEWCIQNFLMTKKSVEVYSSRSFLFNDCRWRLEIGIVENNKWIPFRIYRRDLGPPRTVTCAFGIRKTDGIEEIIFNKETPILFNEEDYLLHVDKFLSKSDLLKRKSDLAPLDALTITCSLKSCESYSVEASLFRRLWNLSECLMKIFRDGKKCDVVLKVKDGEIPVHSMILKQRSEVFARMLNSDMRESQTREIEINDADKEAFEVVLHYLYSGEPYGLFPGRLCEVFKIAHKYDLQELAKLCSEYMQGNLSEYIFCDVISLAEVYEQNDLMECAKHFFVRNTSLIVKSREWKALKEENLALVSELLESIIMENEFKLTI